MECSPAAESAHTVRSSDLRERMRAPVSSSSERLFALSRRVPLSTIAVESDRYPAA